MSNGNAAANAATLSLRDVASILGRNQGPELFFQQTFTPLTSPIIPQNISLNRPMERLHIVFRGRITIAAAGFTPFPEALHNLIQRIRLTGTHRRFGALVPIDLTGGTAARMSYLYRDNGSPAAVRVAGQDVYGGNSAETQSSTSTFTGAIGSHDVEVHWEIPLTPIVNPAAKLTAVPFLYMKDDWQDTLSLQLFFGDGSSLGGVAANVTFTAFGSAVGSPTVSVFTNYEILGPLSQSISPAVVVRTEQPAQGAVTAVANRIRLQLLQKQKTTNVLVKTGTIPAGLSAGVQVFGTLVNTILDQTQILVDNKPLRNNFADFAQRLYAAYSFDVTPQNGYLPFSFIESQNPLTYFRGDLLSGGSTFEVISNVLTAGATQAVNVVQEQVLGDPAGA